MQQYRMFQLYNDTISLYNKYKSNPAIDELIQINGFDILLDKRVGVAVLSKSARVALFTDVLFELSLYDGVLFYRGDTLQVLEDLLGKQKLKQAFTCQKFNQFDLSMLILKHVKCSEGLFMQLCIKYFSQHLYLIDGVADTLFEEIKTIDNDFFTQIVEKCYKKRFSQTYKLLKEISIN